MKGKTVRIAPVRVGPGSYELIEITSFLKFDLNNKNVSKQMRHHIGYSFPTSLI